MRTAKKGQITFIQMYPTLIRMFIVSLIFPVIAVVGMLYYSYLDKNETISKYIEVSTLPSEITEGIDYKNNLYKSRKGSIISIDLLEYKDSYQIAYTSVRDISKEIGLIMPQERVEIGLLIFFLVSMIYAIINAFMIAITQIRREHFNEVSNVRNRHVGRNVSLKG